MAKVGRPKKVKNLGGRPTIMTPQTLDKLKEGFLMGFSDEEACAWANIGNTTLYKYQKKNPEFIKQKEEWKLNPILEAKKTIFDSLKAVKDAQWYLERKKKDEFGTRQEITGKDGSDLIPKFIVQSQGAKEVLEKLYEGSDTANN